MIDINKVELDSFETVSLEDFREKITDSESLIKSYYDIEVSGLGRDEGLNLLEHTLIWNEPNTKIGLIDLEKNYLIKESIDHFESFDDCLENPCSDITLNGQGAAYSGELAYILYNGLSLLLAGKEPEFFLSINSQFFYSIGKVQAFKYLWWRLLEENNFTPKDHKPKITLISSIAEQTIIEPELNILRNNTTALVGVICGVYKTIVLPYTFIMDARKEDHIRAQRIARNSTLMAIKESELSHCINSSAGSFHIEKITQALVFKTWEYLKKASVDESYFQNDNFNKEVQAISDQRAEDIKQGKKVIIGLNKYINKEAKKYTIHPSWKKYKYLKRYADKLEQGIS